MKNDMKESVIRWRDSQTPGDYWINSESISSTTLDWLCNEVNNHYKALDSSKRVYWSMGEILPYEDKQRELFDGNNLRNV